MAESVEVAGNGDRGAARAGTTSIKLEKQASDQASVLLSLIANPASSIAIILPDFLASVNLKYVKLGYHYLITHAMILMVIPLLIITLAESWFRIGWADILQLWDNLHFNLVSSPLPMPIAMPKRILS
jgi:hypothetical protein